MCSDTFQCYEHEKPRGEETGISFDGGEALTPLVHCHFHSVLMTLTVRRQGRLSGWLNGHAQAPVTIFSIRRYVGTRPSSSGVEPEQFPLNLLDNGRPLEGSCSLEGVFLHFRKPAGVPQYLL